MQEQADQIVEFLKDYHHYRGFQFTSAKIFSWVNQFIEEDRLFILEEFLHLLTNGIFINESQGRNLLVNRILSLSNRYRFGSVRAFLENVEFLNIQQKGKSQEVLLNLLNSELQDKFQISLNDCGSRSKKYVLYLDDILATGGTVLKDLCKWINVQDSDGKTNLDKIIDKKIILIVSLFCKHNRANVDWNLKTKLNCPDILGKIYYIADHEIENDPRKVNPRLNFIYPLRPDEGDVLDYFKNSPGTYFENLAYRTPGTPGVETFFSSPDNRARLENIFLLKGIELLQKAGTLQINHRPLGVTSPGNKTFGTGTLFFTWRNISNTCPIVFWWGASGWSPLFPLAGRG